MIRFRIDIRSIPHLASIYLIMPRSKRHVTPYILWCYDIRMYKRETKERKIIRPKAAHKHTKTKLKKGRKEGQQKKEAFDTK